MAVKSRKGGSMHIADSDTKSRIGMGLLVGVYPIAVVLH